MLRRALFLLALCSTLAGAAHAQEDAALGREVQAAGERYRVARAALDAETAKVKLPPFEAKLVTVAKEREPYKASLQQMAGLLRRSDQVTKDYKSAVDAAMRQHGASLKATRPAWEEGVKTLHARLDKVSAVNAAALALMQVQLDAVAWGEKNFATRPPESRYKQLVGMEWNEWVSRVGEASKKAEQAVAEQRAFEAKLREARGGAPAAGVSAPARAASGR